MLCKYYRLLVVALVATAWLGVEKAHAQAGDTLLVEWETAPGSGEPQLNALRDAIIADTDRPANRVYQLRRGGFYWITQPIINTDFPLVIVGQNASQGRPEDNICGPSGTDDCGPAIIQRVSAEDGSAPSGTMFEATDDLTVRRVWIMGQTDVGNLASYEPIKLLGDDKNYVFDEVIFDRNDWHHLGIDGPNNDLFITNSVFRNIFGPTQIWEGLGLRLEVGADTVVIENNTFINIGFTPYQSEAAPANYLRFNHNTLVNIGRAFQAGSQYIEAYVTNNLFINPFIQGNSFAQYNDPERDDPFDGFFSIGALPSQYGLEEQRRIVLANNLHWLDPDFADLHASFDPVIRTQPFVNDTTQGWFDRYEGMVMRDNILDVQPQFDTYPLTDVMLDSFRVYIDNLYANPVVTPAPRWFWDPGREEDCNVCNIWPLPEVLSYSNQDLLSAGTDGLPLGDLNWFPDAKQQFMANRAAYVAEIEALAGEVVEVRPIALLQAESGTLGGNATVESVEGFTSFYMEGGGFIQWTFDLESGGTIGIDVHTQSQDAVRGQRIYLNGTNLRNDAGYGEYYFENLPSDTWATYELRSNNLVEGADALTLEGGTHTIRIEPSWGWQGFSGVDIVDDAGNPVIELRPPDAVSSGVQERCEDADYCPSGFSSVALGAGDEVSFDVSAPESGTYVLRIFYASDAGGSVDVLVDGAAAATGVAIEAGTADVMTDQFQMSSGAHTVTVAGASGTLNVDYVQLLQLGGGGTASERNELPDGYALDQNYPNPFNPATTIRYELGAPGQVTLLVYDLLGRRVATLFEGSQAAGTHHVSFDGSQLPSGVYFYRLETAVGHQVRSMLLIK